MGLIYLYVRIMYVCMYVCVMYVCMWYVCMYVCMFVSMYECIYTENIQISPYISGNVYHRQHKIAV